MSTFIAFLHHVASFTLVSALAVEFVLIRQELTLASARRLPIVDAMLGSLPACG
jgi:putative membrane protein